MAIEACVDVATHIIADRGLRVPTTYSEAFEVLGEAGLLDRGLQATMVAWPSSAKIADPRAWQIGQLSAWISASAFSSQNPMSISRCIVVAALLLGRLDEAWRLAVVGTV